MILLLSASSYVETHDQQTANVVPQQVVHQNFIPPPAPQQIRFQAAAVPPPEVQQRRQPLYVQMPGAARVIGNEILAVSQSFLNNIFLIMLFLFFQPAEDQAAGGDQIRFGDFDQIDSDDGNVSA